VNRRRHLPRCDMATWETAVDPHERGLSVSQTAQYVEKPGLPIRPSGDLHAVRDACEATNLAITSGLTRTLGERRRRSSRDGIRRWYHARPRVVLTESAEDPTSGQLVGHVDDRLALVSMA
jgi:hypothetical protein